ncbi:MAG: TPM domain-containing protein [Candidatus Omnitrophota bacterium]
MKKTIFLILFLAVTGMASGQDAQYPARAQGYVSDYANIISPSDRQKIESLAGALEAKTTAQLAVVTVKTTYPESIEGYAVNLFERWGIGQKGKDNGILILVAYNDRKLRIETGYGLEGGLPDIVCDNIVQRVMVPRFKENRFSQGILEGAAAAVSLVAREYNVTITGQEERVYNAVAKEKSPLAKILEFIFTLLILLLFMSMRMGLLGWFLLGAAGRRRGGYWYGGGYGGSSGGFGGGFGGFGGGLSGGGGSSGGW